jgi:hypothetical protein
VHLKNDCGYSLTHKKNSVINIFIVFYEKYRSLLVRCYPCPTTPCTRIKSNLTVANFVYYKETWFLETYRIYNSEAEVYFTLLGSFITWWNNNLWSKEIQRLIIWTSSFRHRCHIIIETLCGGPVFICMNVSDLASVFKSLLVLLKISMEVLKHICREVSIFKRTGWKHSKIYLRT